MKHLVLLGAALLMCAGCDSGKAAAKGAKTPAKAAKKAAGQKAPEKAAAAPAKSKKKAPAAKAAATGSKNPALTDPSKAAEKAPATYTVKFETTKGDIFIDVTRAWSPVGADRFYNLVKIGYYDDTAFFRVISGFMAQIGIHGTPAVNKAWRPARIQDDKDTPKISNKAGHVTFAKTGAPNSRTTQFFINFNDNGNLDRMGFTPFGKVRDMKTMLKIHSGYGEGAPRGKGPSQGRFQAEGNAYIRAEFPKMDFIKKGTIVPAK